MCQRYEEHLLDLETVNNETLAEERNRSKAEVYINQYDEENKKYEKINKTLAIVQESPHLLCAAGIPFSNFKNLYILN